MSHDKIISIVERMPHLSATDSTGDVYILPIPLIREIAFGRFKADAKIAEILAIAFMDNYYGD